MRMLLRYMVNCVLLLLLCACDSSETNIGLPEAYLPSDPTAVFEIKDLPTFLADSKQNQLLLKSNHTSEVFRLLNNTPFLNYVKTNSTSFIAFTAPNDSTQTITFITPQHSAVFNTDSIPKAQVESHMLSNGNQTYKILIDEKAAFYTLKDSLFIASNSEPNLLQLLEGKTLTSEDFERIARVHDTDDAVLMRKMQGLTLFNSQIENFAGWMSAQVQLTSNSVRATGVVMATDSTSFIEVFKGQIPQQNDLENILPTNAIAAHSVTFSDAALLQQRLQKFRNDSITTTASLFDSANEMGVIQLQEGTAVVLKSIDAVLTQEAWAPFISTNQSFRAVEINNWSKPDIFSAHFSPLVTGDQYINAFQMDQFFVFTENEATAESIISVYKNNNSLKNASWFTDAINYASNASSLMIYELRNSPNALKHIFPTSENTRNNSQTSNYPLSLVQYSYDRNFAHLHLVCQEAKTVNRSPEGVSEQFNIALDQPILLEPQFFTNHRTKKQDILVQDASNTLYLISDKGKIAWSKKLSHPILGSIEEVDVLRNGKKQMVFSTKKALYVLDRNGNAVAPFPLKFKDDITQPVSVFDYDSNRKYRFLIVQNNELYMYDSRGKIVKGFTFKKTKTPIVLPPRHLRIGNKDYISVAEQNGTLNLLSRTGKERVGVTETFDFGEANIQKDGSQFLVITDDLQKKLISSTGKVRTETLSSSESFAYQSLGTTQVSLDDNLLRINKKLIELPFGIYTNPRIFQVNRSIYITMTETQENKVYIYDKAGNLLSGFPVYGTGSAVMRHISGAQKGLLVKGDEQSIVFYTFK